MSDEVYMNELKNSTSQKIKKIGSFLVETAIVFGILYLLVFNTGCATAYNVTTDLGEIQVGELPIDKPIYEEIDLKPVKKGEVFEPTEDGVFIDNANFCKIVRNEVKHGIYEESLENGAEYYKGIIKTLGGVFDETK